VKRKRIFPQLEENCVEMNPNLNGRSLTNLITPLEKIEHRAGRERCSRLRNLSQERYLHKILKSNSPAPSFREGNDMFFSETPELSQVKMNTIPLVNQRERTQSITQNPFEVVPEEEERSSLLQINETVDKICSNIESLRKSKRIQSQKISPRRISKEDCSLNLQIPKFNSQDNIFVGTGIVKRRETLKERLPTYLLQMETAKNTELQNRHSLRTPFQNMAFTTPKKASSHINEVREEPRKFDSKVGRYSTSLERSQKIQFLNLWKEEYSLGENVLQKKEENKMNPRKSKIFDQALEISDLLTTMQNKNNEKTQNSTLNESFECKKNKKMEFGKHLRIKSFDNTVPKEFNTPNAYAQVKSEAKGTKGRTGRTKEKIQDKMAKPPAKFKLKNRKSTNYSSFQISSKDLPTQKRFSYATKKSLTKNTVELDRYKKEKGRFSPLKEISQKKPINSPKHSQTKLEKNVEFEDSLKSKRIKINSRKSSRQNYQNKTMEKLLSPVLKTKADEASYPQNTPTTNSYLSNTSVSSLEKRKFKFLTTQCKKKAETEIKEKIGERHLNRNCTLQATLSTQTSSQKSANSLNSTNPLTKDHSTNPDPHKLQKKDSKTKPTPADSKLSSPKREERKLAEAKEENSKQERKDLNKADTEKYKKVKEGIKNVTKLYKNYEAFLTPNKTEREREKEDKKIQLSPQRQVITAPESQKNTATPSSSSSSSSTHIITKYRESKNSYGNIHRMRKQMKSNVCTSPQKSRNPPPPQNQANLNHTDYPKTHYSITISNTISKTGRIQTTSSLTTSPRHSHNPQLPLNSASCVGSALFRFYTVCSPRASKPSEKKMAFKRLRNSEIPEENSHSFSKFHTSLTMINEGNEKIRKISDYSFENNTQLALSHQPSVNSICKSQRATSYNENFAK
jgi:hypothetical protein